jgi:anti-sigma regulatory factor (Ser/Thr protein kinase)
LPVRRENNRLIFEGELGLVDLLRPLAGLHQAVREDGHGDIVLDFSSSSAAFAAPMLALCAQVMTLRESGVRFTLIPPRDRKLAGLFRNANWSHFIDPDSHPRSAFRGFTQVPGTQFRDAEEQQQAVNRIVNAILGAIPELDRKNLAALEWSINEITDNVLNHSRSKIGGLVQVSTFQRVTQRVEYIVADAGLGIPATLRASHPEIVSDADALDQAIREGVTRDPAIGQGNGLFGSYQICSHSKGFFQLESGYGKLVYNERNGLHISQERVPLNGTLVAAQIDFSVPELLAGALRFGGRPNSVVDFVELHYEQEDGQPVQFFLKDETPSFGSRVAGAPVRVRLANLVRMIPTQRIAVDCSDVPLVSSSFADEVFGKLFAELGPVTFMKRFELRNVNSTVQQLIDKAISQRMGQSKGQS